MKFSKIILISTISLLLIFTCLSQTNFANASDPPSNCIYANSAWHERGTTYIPSNAAGSPDSSLGVIETQWSWGEEYTSVITGTMDGWGIGHMWLCCGKASWMDRSAIIVYVSQSMSGPFIHVGSVDIYDNDIKWREVEAVTEPNCTMPPGYASEPFCFFALVCVSTSATNNNYAYVDSVASQYYFSTSIYPHVYGMYYTPMTFNIVDTNGNPIAGEIYIDGNLVGYNSLTMDMVNYYNYPTTYQLYVAPFDSSYTFQYYTTSTNEYGYTNPIDFYVWEWPVTITAVFAPS